VVQAFELMGFMFVREVHYHLSCAFNAFCSVCLFIWATPLALFCGGFFRDKVWWTICPGWLGNVILLISASPVARIAGVSHWHPAALVIFKTGSCFFCPGPSGPLSSYFKLPAFVEMTGALPSQFLSLEIRFHELFAWAGFKPWSSWSLPPK
jgi:hypothetical protein